MRRTDRSAIKFPDPFPGLEHEMAEVNGVRCVNVHIIIVLQREVKLNHP